jgi:hypothetical protein
MTPKRSFILLLIVSIFFNCKEEKKEITFSDYQYADKQQVLACDNFNSKLLNEALYTFENDLLNYNNNDNQNLTQAYSQFVRLAIYGNVKYADMVSPHNLTVFEALKKEVALWSINDSKSNLNYNNLVVHCIGNNIQDTGLKTTFNALLSTNSMSPKLFGAPLVSNFRAAAKDRYLAAYIALDLYFAKLIDIDFTNVAIETPKQNVDFNLVPQ